MVLEGQIYKNYKELCAELGEPVKGGDSKKAQLARWRTQFDYHTEGYKIIIDKVRENSAQTVQAGGGNNHKNMDIYLPYIYNCIAENFPENCSMTKILCGTLGLFDEKALKKLYESPASETRELRKWVKAVGKFASDTVVRSLNRLQKDGLITYNTAYGFLSKPDRTRYVGYVAGFDEFIAKTEAEVCDQLNKKHHISGKISGKRLEFIINRNKKLAKVYKRRVLERISENRELMAELQDNIDDIYYGIDFGSDDYPIQKYWKVWTVSEVEPPKSIDMALARQKFVDLAIQKGGEAPEGWKNLVIY